MFCLRVLFCCCCKSIVIHYVLIKLKLHLKLLLFRLYVYFVCSVFLCCIRYNLWALKIKYVLTYSPSAIGNYLSPDPRRVLRHSVVHMAPE